MSELPSGWQSFRLGDIADVQLGKMLSAKSKTGKGGRPYLRNVNVRWGRIDTHDVFEMEFDAREVEKYRLVSGDVLVCEGGEPGRAAVWQDQLRGALYQKALHRVRFRAHLFNPRLFVHLLELDALSGAIAARFTGSTIKHLPREAFLEYELPVAPIAEQRRIIAVIEEHLSDIDAAVAALERVRANLKRYRAAVLNDLWAGLDRGESEWSATRLADLSWHSGYGTSEKCDYSGRGLPVLRIPNISGGRLDLSDLKRAVGPSAVRQEDALHPGDLLIVRTNGSRDLIGRGAVVERSFDAPHYFASYLIRYRLRGDAWMHRWIGLAMQSPRVRSVLENLAASSAGQYNLSVAKLDEILLPLPPTAVGIRLLAKVEHHIATAERAEDDVDSQLRHAVGLRQSILKRAFEGRLVPQDPKDEPASVLLDRICAERAAAPTERRTRPKRASR